MKKIRRPKNFGLLGHLILPFASLLAILLLSAVLIFACLSIMPTVLALALYYIVKPLKHAVKRVKEKAEGSKSSP